MADCSFITYRLATGGAIATEAELRELVRLGITHIIDLRTANALALMRAFTHSRRRLSPTEAPDLVHVHYLHNGAPDDGQPKPVRWFKQSIGFALDALSRPRTRVFAHCAAGVNRGPSTVFAILLALGIERQTAEGMIRANRPQAQIGYLQDAWNAVGQLGYL